MTAVREASNNSAEDILSGAVQNLPKRFELIDGKVIEVAAMGIYASFVANRLNEKMVLFGRATGRGKSRMGILYEMPIPEDPTRCRRPNFAFITDQKWNDKRPISFTRHSIDVVPDLTAEIIRPHDGWEDVVDKAYEYLRAGVRLVWLITPKQKQVYVYKSRDEVRIVNATDTLDGGDVLPGFEVNVGSLFPPMTVSAP